MAKQFTHKQGIKPTKRQQNAYHKSIKKLVIDPLSTQIIARLSAVPKFEASWQHAINSAFIDTNYNNDVDNGSEDLANDTIKDVAVWHKKKLETQFASLLSLDITPILNEEATASMLNPIIEENIGLIKSISPELLGQVNEEYQNIIRTDGFNPNKVLNMLTDRFSVSDSRAKLIAHDQIGKTVGALTKTRNLQAGVKRFIWRTAEDAFVRPEHQDLDSKIFLWSAPPSIGTPGQPIRCRCVALPIID